VRQAAPIDSCLEITPRERDLMNVTQRIGINLCKMAQDARPSRIRHWQRPLGFAAKSIPTAYCGLECLIAEDVAPSSLISALVISKARGGNNRPRLFFECASAMGPFEGESVRPEASDFLLRRIH